MAQDETLSQLERIEQSVSLAPAESTAVEVVPCGPFRAFLSLHTDDPELNYAMQTTTSTDRQSLTAAIEALRRVFAARQRRLRLEFMEELWPDLSTAASRAGLQLANREPLMTCTPASFQPVAAPRVQVAFLRPEDDDTLLRVYLAIRDEQPEDQIETAEVGRLRDLLQGGAGWFALARLAGQPAGTGRCAVSRDGLGELSAIVTRPEQRRQGIAATTTSVLLQAYFGADGSLAWLSAANPEAASVYARVGFWGLGHLLNYEDPPAD
jgi:hypothetical protein